MTYLTPDFIALRTEAEHYAKRHPLRQGPRFAGGGGFRGEHLPLLSAAPIPPLHVKDLNPPVIGPIPGRNAITISPMDEAFQDYRGPGMFIDMTQLDPVANQAPPRLEGLGSLGTWAGIGGIAVASIALIIALRRR